MLTTFFESAYKNVFPGDDYTHNIALWIALLISYRKVNDDDVLTGSFEKTSDSIEERDYSVTDRSYR